eukprot:3269223-Amphidinium_carterae.1
MRVPAEAAKWMRGAPSQIVEPKLPGNQDSIESWCEGLFWGVLKFVNPCPFWKIDVSNSVHTY